MEAQRDGTLNLSEVQRRRPKTWPFERLPLKWEAGFECVISSRCVARQRSGRRARAPPRGQSEARLKKQKHAQVEDITDSTTIVKIRQNDPM